MLEILRLNEGKRCFFLSNINLKFSDTKPSVPITDDEDYDYSKLVNRDDHKKKFLPAIRGLKM